ncbi:DUF3093 domain-containing protein [Streptomyces sp. NPDC056500]|uniref:DUF3093 domain-containing protein n=1 Tax=Streptomyces sp. NPDC056500 TaxID=3345840 RepID=UPI003685ACC2
MHLYEERLTVPRTWWLLAALTGVALALVLLPFGLLVAAAALAGGVTTVSLLGHAYGSARIVVTPGALVLGGRRIPLGALGATEILDEREAFAWRTWKANPYAMLLIRGYVRTALRIELKNDYEGAPYVYVSTRQPMNLAVVLAFARG